MSWVHAGWLLASLCVYGMTGTQSTQAESIVDWRAGDTKGFLSPRPGLAISKLNSGRQAHYSELCFELWREGTGCPVELSAALNGVGADSFTIEQTPHLRIDVFVTSYENTKVTGTARDSFFLTTLFTSESVLPPTNGSHTYFPELGFKQIVRVYTLEIENGCQAGFGGADLTLMLELREHDYSGTHAHYYHDTVPSPGYYTWSGSVDHADGEGNAIAISARGFLTASCTGWLDGWAGAGN